MLFLQFLVSPAMGQTGGATGASEIRDIVDDPPPFYWPPVIFITLSILLLITAVVIYCVLSYRKKNPKPTGPPPEVVARLRLQELQSEAATMAPNKAGLEASEIVKDFLTSQYGDPIRYETAEEYLSRIAMPQQQAGAPVFSIGLLEQVKSFMSISQELKFAQLKEAKERIPNLVSQAEKIVSLALEEGPLKQ